MASIPSSFIYNQHLMVIGTQTRIGTASLYRLSTAEIGCRCMISLHEQFIVEYGETIRIWDNGPVSSVENSTVDLTNVPVVVRIDPIYTPESLAGWRKIFS